jgi:hypothetical protein
MQGQTRILWDFLQAAYKNGALDNFMELSRAATDKKYENQATVFAQLEDAICEMEDFSSVDETLATAFKQMPALTDDEILQGLGALVVMITPVIDSTMESVDRDSEALKEKLEKLSQDLPKIASAVSTLVILNSETIASALGKDPARLHGERVGKGLNGFSSFINDINDRDPSAIPEFMSGLFSSVDGNSFTKAADILTHALLDQKPPVLKWTASTMAKRAGKIVLNK